MYAIRSYYEDHDRPRGHEVGEGCDGLFVGLPAKLGAGGVEEVVRFHLSPEETTALAKSADEVRILCEAVDRLGF